MTFTSNETKKRESTLEVFYQPVEPKFDSLPRFGIRHLQVFVLFLNLLVAYGIRAAMGVSLVAMAIHSSENSNIRTFDWDKKTQDIIASSFFWGYMVMQLPAGQIAFKFGGKPPIVIALIINGLISIVLPFIADKGGWQAICVARVFQGLGQGFLMPCIQNLMGRWVPTEERSRLGSFIQGGTHLGVVSMMMLAGFLSSTRFGWPSVFYVLGGLSLVFGIAWQIIGANSPAEHKYITEEEKHYIQTSIGRNTTKKLTYVPWRKIITSVPVLALCVSHIGLAYGQVTIMSQIPAFMTKVMGVNINQSGFLSALPFLAKWCCMTCLGFLFDFLINHGYLRRVVARKLAQTIGSWPVAVGFIVLAYAPKNIIFVEVLLIIICSFFSATSLGTLINHMDLSPNYSGTLMSMSNFCANIFSIFAPITAGFILTDDTDANLWRIVFFVTAAIFFVTNLIFLIFGSATLMPWDDPDYKEENSDANDGKLNEVSEEKLVTTRIYKQENV